MRSDISYPKNPWDVGDVCQVATCFFVKWGGPKSKGEACVSIVLGFERWDSFLPKT